MLIQIYLVICVVRVIMSWLDMGGSGTIMDSIGQIAIMLTEPLFRTVRNYMPRMGDLPIDLSPLVVFLALGFLRTIVCGLA
jgi:YggT family protein